MGVKLTFAVPFALNFCYCLPNVEFHPGWFCGGGDAMCVRLSVCN